MDKFQIAVLTLLALIACTVFAGIGLLSFAYLRTTPQQTSSANQSVSANTVVPTNTAIPTETPTPKPPTATPAPKFANVKPLGCEYDEFQEINWCSKYNTADIDDVVITHGDAVDVAVYVGLADGRAFMRWDIDYKGDDWIFIDEIMFLIDGTRYDIPVYRYDDISTDVCCGGTVFELYDRKVDSPEILLRIVNAREVKIRVSGDDGYHDHTLTRRQIEIITRALATYEKNGGAL